MALGQSTSARPCTPVALQGGSALHAHHGANDEHSRLQDHADGADTQVFAARQASQGYPAQAGQKAYRVYLAQQARPGSQAWQARLV
jgi:hypothetical protein